MDDWWAEIENDVLAALAGNGVMTPAEVGRRLGMSEAGATSLLSTMAREGRVRLCAVEAVAAPRLP